MVTAPRYTTVDKVFTLKLGMTQSEVAEALDVQPYYLYLMTDSVTVFLYKYRVTDRTTLPVLLKQNNGKSVLGKYINLLVTYNSKGLAKKYESSSTCDVTTVATDKLNISEIITFITVTLPVVLLFVGIKLVL
ncbi:MAG TPA: hypothetical protein VNZ45_03400 [Bacteroidia bacterium]|nr:hypothetical protein [Bacteroidia bacterium]